MEAVDDEELLGRDSSYGPGVVQGGPELFAMSGWPAVGDGPTVAQRHATICTRRNV